jgi:hypothetical protein
MIRVYVAGPYSSDNVLGVLTNMRVGMRKSTELLLKGYAPFCSWLDHHFTLMLQGEEQLTVPNYYDYSLAFLEVSQAVLLLPGYENSKGTLAEIKRAEELGIPIFEPNEEDIMDKYFKEIKDGSQIVMGIDTAKGKLLKKEDVK